VPAGSEAGRDRHGPTVPEQGEQSRPRGGHLAQPHASDCQTHKSVVIQAPGSSQGVNFVYHGLCPDQCGAWPGMGILAT